MTIFHNLGNEPDFRNQFRNFEKEKILNSHTHEQACIFSNSLIKVKRNCCFFCSWVKATDKESIRLATKNKKPQYWTGSDWPNIKEKRCYQELLRQYGEWGTRTGKKLGQKYYVRVDMDLAWLPATLRENLERGFLLMLSRVGIIFIKTKRGYHIILLLDELPLNGKIYHTDKFGVKRKIGDILSTGRQAQDLGSPEKIQPTAKGKWFWQDKNIEAVNKIFAKYFFSLECKENSTQKSVSKSTSEKKTNGIEIINSTKPVINQDKKAYIRLAEIIKKELFKPWIKRDKPIYKVWYQQTNQSKRYFLLDTYQKHREMVIDQLSTGTIASFVLNQGNPYQFFYKFAYS